MDEKKRKRLEQAGWKVGDTQEFLGLSDEEMEEVDARLSAEKDEEGIMANQLMVGKQALHLLGSSLHSHDVHYLTCDASTEEAYISDPRKKTVYLNANGHPLFRQVWEMEQENIGPYASPQALLELMAFDYVQHCRNGFWIESYGDELSIKFLAGKYNLTKVTLVGQYIEAEELADIRRIISRTHR